MQQWRIKPSKPAAALSLVVGIGILVFGVTSAHKFTPFLIFWTICVVAIVAFNLWSAFSSRGSMYSVQSDSGDGSANPRRR